jgi:Methyltransferase domain
MKAKVKTLIPPRYFPVAYKLNRWLKMLRYIGNQVYCPCCDHHFRCFLPFGYKTIRQNALCPNCGALERQRLLWLYLPNRTNLFRDRLRVLHFAPEDKIQKKLRACPNLDYTSADLDSPLAMIKMDITRIPYAECTVDAILCSHVLEHIPDDRKAMSELYRILKPGGWAILLVPLDLKRIETFEDPNVIDPKERFRLFDQADHVRIYGRDFKNRLERVGFTVYQDSYARGLDPVLIQRYGLLMDEDVFYCTKPEKLGILHAHLRIGSCDQIGPMT